MRMMQYCGFQNYVRVFLQCAVSLPLHCNIREELIYQKTEIHKVYLLIRKSLELSVKKHKSFFLCTPNNFSGSPHKNSKGCAELGVTYMKYPYDICHVQV